MTMDGGLLSFVPVAAKKGLSVVPSSFFLDGFLVSLILVFHLLLIGADVVTSCSFQINIL